MYSAFGGNYLNANIFVKLIDENKVDLSTVGVKEKFKMSRLHQNNQLKLY